MSTIASAQLFTSDTALSNTPIIQNSKGLIFNVSGETLKKIADRGECYTQSFFEKILGLLGISNIGEMKEDLSKLLFGKTPEERIDGFFAAKDKARWGSVNCFSSKIDGNKLELKISNGDTGLKVSIDTGDLYQGLKFDEYSKQSERTKHLHELRSTDEKLTAPQLKSAFGHYDWLSDTLNNNSEIQIITSAPSEHTPGLSSLLFP
ncbi:hypothetical protein [Pseudomonas entomophila]|uniref:hypothetical protein n=1 Tax=Pseudomonas entomophila TaxID=312306 RepID=UPI001F011239|nr:hypothetical protein [Pseudomonas entomophila]MCG8291490.1 hypothetical protein [Pseudomonas entomophila]